MLRLRMFLWGPHSWAGLLTAILLAIPVSAVPAQNTGDVNLAAALENTCVIGILTPQRAIADKSAELVPWELISVAGVEEFGGRHAY